MKYVVHFSEIDRQSLPIVGGKGANLGEMTRAGFPVPSGFCVTTSAYRHFIESSNEMDKWLDLLHQLKSEQLDEIRKLGQRIRDHLLTLRLSEQIQSAIINEWTQLGQSHAYAVRSSATAEDLPTASFAGQQETYLNVKGADQLIAAVKKCWASLFTDRAIVYRIKNGFDHRSVFLSVVVQKMVFPDVSGIMFTADPINGNRRIVSIDAGFGLGEALVSGMVTADLYQVRDNQIILKQIAKKEKGVFALPQGGTEVKELPPEIQSKQTLSDQKIIELAALGRKIEKHYGSEQDIEWCIAEDQIYIVQSRPITSLYPVPKAIDNNYRIYLSFGHKQMMTDYIKPLGISILRTLFPYDKDSIRDESRSFVEAGGRLFVDCSDLMYPPFVQRKLKEIFEMEDQSRKISKLSETEDDLLALKKAVLRDEFKQRAPKRGINRKIIRLIKPLFGFVSKICLKILKIIFWEDPFQAIQRTNASYEKNICECKQAVIQSSGVERIKSIQEFAGGKLFFSLFDSLSYSMAGFIALSMIENNVKKWLGEELSGSIHKSPPGNVTSEMGLMIGDLADILRDYPRVVEYLQHAKDNTFYEGLKGIEGGNVFKAELDRFMEKYGMRAQGEIDITRTRWKEAPTMLIPSILSHMRSNAPKEHREKFEQGQQEANKEIQSLLERVKATHYGSKKAKKLSRLFTIYRNTIGIREFPKYIIIQYFGIFREGILEEAKILYGKGVIDHPEDVFYLTLDELVALLENRLKKVRSLINSRKKLETQYQKLNPPRVITSDGEIFSADRKNEQAPPGSLIGIPVSAGVVEGYVKVVRRLEDGLLTKGDILVAPYTDPGWTPLFHSAKALVTEIGGMMTHGSVVAREYGIPAVVGVENATKLLKDGQYIRVDGSKGYVQILDLEQE
ncbi:phosphoenolpyruvate synthase [Thermoflavimicrobium daqui]|uniref:Phosphoenolpyruvate synthase n=1 Tax=Thermoflavimicrobium daqui TaxID=2137476 RepID=A0A364K438_9BACL|nr:phosphoenolpyruvate synthase [Thermoflavimicrobium daqui]RAL24116.1 phosphoenolpyruvate synthase [Thermoflavimicrobium daqui]